MKALLEKRIHERRDYGAPIIVSIFNKKKFFDAQTLNNCTDGICFKSSTFLRPGTTVYLRVKKFLPDTSGTCAFEGLRAASLGEIKWCRELADTDAGTYEVGVKYPGPAY
ncbi:MAG: hypothetical protein B6I22_11040 [Desulfobacteraceae bacterium 4572_123]|nr:MAG: hypothetical protein B6I22_11040 [Desulfobacteraceae bacterium 4572_123]